ncbi:hypothetical protein HYQ45_010594 [Verticillium longisporum]|uniref:Uncharacterized protein n=1 Tax=Verticillium longisporum TaxID=100787 RepID=A0A8I2ZIH9_VERLO|nr:hypothetical protein HYQ45_010594 [Verticillium longisporum]KAG7144787.1 hypothetical protein HYQ46_006477 [Verticillium longisporum]
MTTTTEAASLERSVQTGAPRIITIRQPLGGTARLTSFCTLQPDVTRRLDGLSLERGVYVDHRSLSSNVVADTCAVRRTVVVCLFVHPPIQHLKGTSGTHVDTSRGGRSTQVDIKEWSKYV